MTQLTADISGQSPPPAPKGVSAARPRRSLADALLTVAVRGAGVGVVILLVALIFVLTRAAWPSITQNGLGFLTGTTWRVNELEQPLRDASGSIIFDEDGEMSMVTIPPVFGAAPVIYGTAVSSLIALLIAVPMSLGAAMFLVRIAPRLKVAGPIAFFIEFLAAIPSLAYGVWGIFVLVPFMGNVVGPAAKATLGQVPIFDWLFFRTINLGGVETRYEIAMNGWNMLTGATVLAIMILPIITAISRDVLRAVPRAQVEASLALGATWWQSSWMMIRYARAGLFGAIILGLARAAGETMAITMVIGNKNQIAPSIFEPAQTMSSLLATEFAEAKPGTGQFAALLHVALVLLVLSLAINMLARWLVVGSGTRRSSAQ
jgi:phosphate transport system permease protein